MSTNQINAGQSHGHAQAKAEDWMNLAKNTANAAHDKAADATNNASGQAQQKKEESAGFLQQTGEQVTHMAQNAMDGLKNTLGMGDQQRK